MARRCLRVYNGQNYLINGFIVLALGSLGLLITRPILHADTFSLPHAEALRFQYPITTVALQFISTFVLLLVGGWTLLVVTSTRSVTNEYKKEHDFVDTNGRDNKDRSKHADGLQVNQMGRWSMMLDTRLLQKLILLAFVIAVEALASTYVLYHAPLRFYRLSLSIAPIATMIWLMNLKFDLMPIQKFIPTIMTMSFLGVISTHESSTWTTWGDFWASVVSAACASGWPVLLDWAWSQAPNETVAWKDYEDIYITGTEEDIASLETLKVNTHMGYDLHESWRTMCHLSFLVVVIILPVLWLSGEVGHALRNCYFLDDHLFWLQMCISGIARFSTFVSSIFIVWRISALRGKSGSFEYVVGSSVINLIWISTILPDQFFIHQLGTYGCTLTGLWCLKKSMDYSLSARLERMPSPGPRLQRLINLGLLLGVVLFLYSIVSKIRAWSNETSRRWALVPLASGVPVPLGDEGYLGDRAALDGQSNVAGLLDSCGEHSQFSNCLTYLSNHRHSSGGKSGNGIQLKRTAETRPIDDELYLPLPHCNGPQLQYHVEISGSPTPAHLLTLKSYLHTQNTACSHLTVWSTSIDASLYDADRDLVHEYRHLTSTMRRPYFRHHISFRTFALPKRLPVVIDPQWRDYYLSNKRSIIARRVANPKKGEKMTQDGIVRDVNGTEWFVVDDSTQVQYVESGLSRLMKWFVLHVHGGIWLDAKMLLLQDLRPLVGAGEALRPLMIGDASGFKDEFVAVNANSTFTATVIRAGINQGLNYHPDAVRNVLQKENLIGNDGFVVLNPAILGMGGTGVLRQKNIPMQDISPGAFALTIGSEKFKFGKDKEKKSGRHWKDLLVDIGLGDVVKEHDAFFSGERANPYGEKWTRRPIIGIYEN